MRALVIVAHGSRRTASNDEVRELTGVIRAQASEFDHVSCAFLELADPSIAEGIQAAITAGAKEVVVVPYFLSAGRHVAEDIPGLVTQTQSQNPHVRIRLAPYLGTADDLALTLLKLAN